MKYAYLTIDDAPSVDFRRKVNYLDERNIPALFFCVGRDIQACEADVVDAIRKGFLIGNHSYSHPYFSDLPLEACLEEIRRTDVIITEIYQRLGLEWPIKTFRFPYFDSGGDESSEAYELKWGKARGEWFRHPHEAKRIAIQETLRDLGYRQPRFQGINHDYFTDVDLLTGFDLRCTFDQSEYWLGKAEAPWGLSTAEAILARIEEDEPYNGRSLNREDTSDIILVHDHENTTELFFTIIDRYLAKGIRFMPINTEG